MTDAQDMGYEQHLQDEHDGYVEGLEKRVAALEAGPPSVDELEEAWSEVLAELAIPVRSKWRGGKWIEPDPDLHQPGTVWFAVPNEWHQKVCEDTQTEVENALWAHFGREVAIQVVVDGGNRLADVIRQARDAAGISQVELARQVGVDQTVVSSWMRGRAKPPLDRIIALDGAFGLRAGTLLERAGMIEPPSIEELLEEHPEIELDDAGRRQVLATYNVARIGTAERSLESIDQQLHRLEHLATIADMNYERALEVGDDSRQENAKAELLAAREKIERLQAARDLVSDRLANLLASEDLSHVGAVEVATGRQRSIRTTTSRSADLLPVLEPAGSGAASWLTVSSAPFTEHVLRTQEHLNPAVMEALRKNLSAGGDETVIGAATKALTVIAALFAESNRKAHDAGVQETLEQLGLVKENETESKPAKRRRVSPPRRKAARPPRQKTTAGNEDDEGRR